VETNGCDMISPNKRRRESSPDQEDLVPTSAKAKRQRRKRIKPTAAEDGETVTAKGDEEEMEEVETAPILRLPPEMLQLLFGYLPIHTAAVLNRVS